MAEAITGSTGAAIQPFLEATLLGPVALGDRVGEGARQRIPVVGRGEPAPSGLCELTCSMTARDR